MSYSPRLISNLRALFGCGRVLTFCLLIGYPLLSVFLGGKALANLGEIHFRNPAAKLTGATASGPGQEPLLRELRGQISLPLNRPEDQTVHLFVSVLPATVSIALSFLACQWLWQLCRNVENHEVFTSSNMKLIRYIGLLLVIETFARVALSLATAGYVANFVSDRVTVTGLDILAPSGFTLFYPEAIDFNLTQLITGLLVLCLAEIFRQGLKLKQESELTV